nr:MAG TPA: hypothetical protein [Caudoviricetes sp.]
MKVFHYSLNYWLAIFNLYYFCGFRSIKVKIYILYSYFFAKLLRFKLISRVFLVSMRLCYMGNASIETTKGAPLAVGAPV